VDRRAAIAEISGMLPDGQLDQLLDYARYLRSRSEGTAWQAFGQLHLAKAYGDDEPEYSDADLREDSSS